jgi:hypothetical protein
MSDLLHDLDLESQNNLDPTQILNLLQPMYDVPMPSSRQPVAWQRNQRATDRNKREDLQRTDREAPKDSPKVLDPTLFLMGIGRK